ncbi:hypothetical protein XENOCAPTIV_011388, partial [Xenoophorus captivus]
GSQELRILKAGLGKRLISLAEHSSLAEENQEMARKIRKCLLFTAFITTNAIKCGSGSI